MVKRSVLLTEIEEGETVVFRSVEGGQTVRKKLRDMGLKEGMKLRVMHSHGQGSCIILVGHTRLVIGRGMTAKIKVEKA